MLEKLLKNLEAAERESDLMDEKYEADPENKELEMAWLEAYNKAFDAHEAVADFLTKVLKANGMQEVDHQTVRKMIAEHRNELATIAANI